MCVDSHAHTLFYRLPLFSTFPCYLLKSNIWGQWNQVRNKYTDKVYIVAESRLSALHNPKEKPKEAVTNRSVSVPKNTNAKNKGPSSGKADNVLDSFEVLQKFSGASLVGMKWEVFPCTTFVFLYQFYTINKINLFIFPFRDSMSFFICVWLRFEIHTVTCSAGMNRYLVTSWS